MSSTYVRSVHSHACQNGCIFMWFEDLFVLSLCEIVFPHILSWVQRLSSFRREPFTSGPVYVV